MELRHTMLNQNPVNVDDMYISTYISSPTLVRKSGAVVIPVIFLVQ